jgi:hypothetical protein
VHISWEILLWHALAGPNNEHLSIAAPPLLIMEFLNHVSNVFVDYFGAATEAVLLAHTVTVYQVAGIFDNSDYLTL